MQRCHKLDFICLGFAKCGTTTLHNILDQHPDIYLPGVKEPVFWIEKIRGGGKWYLNRYYREAREGQLTGEINPQLTSGRVSLLDIKSCLKSKAKIILMMRNPVERLYSHFFMQLMWGKPKTVFSNRSIDMEHYDKLFESFVRKEIIETKQISDSYQTILHKGLFIFGDYVYWLQKCIDVFGSSNIFIVIFEEFMKDKKRESKKIFDFLEIQKEINLNYNIKSNEGIYLPKNTLCMEINRSWYFDIWPRICTFVDINKSVDKFMDIHMNWNMRKNKFLLKKVNRRQMTVRTRQLLYDIYMPEIEKLEEIIQKPLNNVWY